MVFGALPQEKLCVCKKETSSVFDEFFYTHSMTENAELEKHVAEFLDLWQENIRLWSVDKELLTPDDLKALLSPAFDEQKR